MWQTSEIKQRGRAAFKLNYWKSVIVSIILGLFTTGTVTLSYNQSTDNTEGVQESFNQLQQAVNNLSPAEQTALALGIAGGLTFVLVISVLIKIFVANPLEVGCYSFFKENIKEPPADLGCIGAGFGNYLHTFITLFLTDLFLTLWTLLFIIPGIIKGYSYRMVPYILTDHPELSPTETIELSKQMMNGHKWHAFCYDLSFIGWYLLTVLTLGILGIFWVGPYKDNSDAALYLEIKGNN